MTIQKPRKARSDSVTTAMKRVQTLNEVERHIVPTGFSLDEEELATFTSYSQTREEWTPAELHLLARLSQAECEIQRQTVLIREEGEVMTLTNGIVVPNPRYKIVAQTERSHLQLVGKLHIAITNNDAGASNSTSRGMRPVKSSGKPTHPIDWTEVKA